MHTRATVTDRDGENLFIVSHSTGPASQAVERVMRLVQQKMDSLNDQDLMSWGKITIEVERDG